MLRKLKLKIKDWLGLIDLEYEVGILKLREVQDETPQSHIANKLGSIDLSDVRDTKKTEQEIKEYNAAISVVFEKYLKPKIKQLIVAQEEFMARQAANLDQFAMGRGTINGLFLLLDEFETAHNNHLQSTKPEERPDIYSLFPEIPLQRSIVQKDTPS